MLRVGRLPAALVTLVLRNSGRLGLAALGTELALIHRAAGAGPAVRCGGGLGLAAFRAEFSGGGGAAGALPAVPGRLRLRLLAAAVGTEVAGDAALTAGAGPALHRGSGGGLRRLLLGLLLLAHLEQVLGVHAAHLAGHAHAHKGHGGTGAGVGGRRLHRLALRADEMRRRAGGVHKKPGDMAFIRVASYYPVTMFSQVRTLPRGSAEAQYCELDVVPGDLNRFTLTGCLPQRSEPLPLAFAVQDGASYAGAILKDELKQAGITWSGTLLRQTQVNEPGTVVASKQSAPVHDLLKIMLKKSDNMIADTVFRMIGHARFNVPGTWRAGSDAVRQILRQQAGVDIGNTIIADGSGLSRHNLIAPATMMQVLQYIAQHDNELNFISMLPLAGYDGSLQYRAGLHQAGVDGKVSAKTGSLQGVYNLAGFITTASGQRMAFVQYLSGYAVEPADQRNRRIPLVRFESRLYKDIYQNN